MRTIALSEVKDHLSEFVTAAQGGDEIIITRHGKPAAKLVAVQHVHDDLRAQRIDAIAKLAANREKMRTMGMTATIEEMIAWKNEGQR